MHRFRHIVSALTVVTLAAFGLLDVSPARSIAAQPAVSEAVLTEFERLIEAELAHYDIPGAAVAVIAGDEVVYARGFGLRDVAAEAPFTTETRFLVGSTTKSMTALLIAMLVDDGLLTWETPVTELFPTFTTADPELTTQMTVADLMGMATGLTSSPLGAFAWGDWDIDGLLSTIAAQPITGEPGTVYNYNNEVYALAGYAAAVASGRAPTSAEYAALMQERVFDPLGMTTARVTDDMSALGDDVALSYEPALLAEGMQLMPTPPIGIVAPAGATWMSIDDMARYVIMQMNGGVTPDGTRLVSAETLAATWEPGVAMPEPAPGIADTAYGMGWVTQTYAGVPIRFHDGGWAGYSTQMAIYPDDDAAVIVFSNASVGQLFGQTLVYAFPELLHDLEPTAVDFMHGMMDDITFQIDQARQAFSPEIADAAAMVGTYENGFAVEQRADGSVWLLRGGWEFQIAAVPSAGIYMLASGGAAGLPIALEGEGDAAALVLTLGPGETLPLARIE